jgi:hypothetical protein
MKSAAGRSILCVRQTSLKAMRIVTFRQEKRFMLMLNKPVRFFGFAGRSNKLASVAVMLVALGVSACGAEASEQGENVWGSSEALWQWDTAWPGGIVPVCWDPASVQRSDFVAVSRLVRDLANASFPVVANVEFTGWGTCGANINGKLSIRLTNGEWPNVDRAYSPSAPSLMVLDVDRDMILDIPHEFAHALGFAHEFERADWVAPPTRPDCVAGPSISGDPVGTPSDFDSITVTTYCDTKARPWELSLWDAVGARKVYGPRVDMVRPLITAWNSSRNDNATVSTTQGIDSLNAAGYTWAFAHGWVFASQLPGTVPLKLYWHTGRLDNVLVATTAGQNEALAAGYSFVRVEGYVFSNSQGSFTVPLKLYWHTARLDNLLVTPGFSENQAIAAGYTFVRTEGYIPDQTPYALLWTYWSEVWVDNLATKENTELSIDAANSGYAFNGFDGAVWRFPFQGTRALKQYWNASRSDHFLVGTTAGEQSAASSGYSLASHEDILGEPGDTTYVGYVHPSVQTGLVPLKSYWNAARIDNFTTISRGSVATAQGYSLIRTEGWGIGIND